MNKQRKTSHILNVFQYDADGHVVLPASLTLGIVPGAEDNSGKVPSTAWVRSLVTTTGGSLVPTNRSITINGTSFDLSSNRSFSIDTGILTASSGSGISVSVVSQNLNIVNTGLLTGTAGAGISVSTVNQNLNIVNTGLLSATAGSGISVSTVNQNLNIVNTGLLTASSGLGISVSTVGQNLNIVNTGILTASAGSGISLSVVSQNLNIVNTGILTATAGAGISLSVVSGNLNIVNTITNNNQLDNGAGYATTSYVTTQINNLVAGAPGLLDTLDELAQALGDDANFATTTATSLGNRLRIDTASQGLNSTQQANGRTNLGLGSAALAATGDFATAAQGTKADTAHGWGNHASAGYLTTSSAASTYVSLTGSYANPSWITSLAYSKLTGVPSTFTPSSHTHAISEVTGLQTALDGKQATLGFTPYNSTNPSGYITSSALSPYLLKSGGTMSGTLTLASISGTDQTVENTFGDYLHLGAWGVGRTAVNAVLVNTAYRADYATDLFDMNISRFTNNSGYITSSALSSYLPLSGGTLSNTLNIGAGGSTNGSLLNVTGGVHNQVNISHASSWGLLLGYCNEGSVSGYHGPNSAAIINVQDGPLHLGAGNASVLRIVSTGASILGNTIWHQGNLTNLNQLSNGPGYITSSGSISGNAATAGSSNFLFLQSTGNLRTISTAGIYREEQPDSGFSYTTTLNMNSSDGRQQLTIERGGGGMKFRGSTSGSGDVSWSGWRDVLHSSNYTSYSPTLTGGGASGTWAINITGGAGSVSGLTLNNFNSPINPDNVTQNQLGYNTSVNLFGQTDGGLYSSAYSSNWIHQIYGDFRSGQIAIRGKQNGTWQSWRTVLDSGNFSSYALPLSGGELSGPLYVGATGSGVYTAHWKDGGGSYQEAVGNSTATRKLRLQSFNGSSSYAQWFMDGGNMQIYGTVAGNTNLLIDTSAIYLRWSGADKFWTGSDGVRVQGWQYFQNGSQGIHYPGANAHFYNSGGQYWHMNGTEGSSFGGLILYSGYNSASGGSGSRKGYLYWDSNGFGLLDGGTGSWAINIHPSNPNRVTIGGYPTANAYNSLTGARLMFGGGNDDASNNYYIGTNIENYGGSYNKLDLRWHTGIRMGAQPVYGGIRFFNSEALSTRIMSIGETDSNIRIDNNLWIGGAGGWITDLFNAKQNASTAINTSNIGNQSVSYANNAGNLSLQGLGNGSVNVNNGSSAVYRNENGAGGNLSYAPVLHLGGGDTMWQIQGDYYNSSTLRWRAGYAGSWYAWRDIIHSANIGSQSVNYANNCGTLEGNSAASFVRSNVNAVTIQRHFDASTTWTSGILSLFLGWYGGKVILGNNNNSGHDYASGLGSNTVVSTNPFFCHQDITAFSDARVKENVEVVDNAVDKVKAIRGVTFTRNDTNDQNKRHVGVIAQEVLAVLPEAVSEDERGHYSVAYGNMAALFIEAIKEQQKQIEELQNKLDNVLSSR
jgi:uncharacterized protein YfkK (UPF0435 family)